MGGGVAASFCRPGRTTPLPPLFVSVPGEALGQRYGESSACAAAMKTVWCGKAELSITRTRRVLRTITAPIFKSFARSVVARSRANSVPERVLGCDGAMGLCRGAI